MNPRNNRCVTFDLWETLIFDDPDKDAIRGRMRYDGLQRVLAEHGIRISTDDLKRGYEQSGAKLQAVWSECNEVSMVDQVRLIVALAAGRPVQIETSWVRLLEKAYVDPILLLPPRLSAYASKVLETVRNRGYKIGLICNTGRSPGTALRQILDSYGVLKFFDATVFSNEIGRRKPDRSIFDRTGELLDSEMSAIVHVGDNPESDFWGARNAGMRSILLHQSALDHSGWGPDSLFFLTRTSMRKSVSDVDPRWRIASLAEAPERIDSLFAT